jgi:threonine/homoserine/homoserine lactone efflux protein
LVSDGPIVAVTLLAVAGMPQGFLRGLEVAGGVFLVWLAWGAFRTAGDTNVQSSRRSEGVGGSLLRAAVVNAAGPGPWIFWSTVCGPILIEAWRSAPASGIAFLLGFYVLLVGGKAALVVAFGLAGRIGPRTARGLGLASAVLMAGMGALQLWRGISGLTSRP